MMCCVHVLFRSSAFWLLPEQCLHATGLLLFPVILTSCCLTDSASQIATLQAVVLLANLSLLSAAAADLVVASLPQLFMLFCVVAHNSMPWKKGTANNSFKSGLVGDKMPSIGQVSLSSGAMLWLYVGALRTMYSKEARLQY